MVDVSKKVHIDVDSESYQNQQKPPKRSLEQMEEMCERNRLRKKFPQIDKGIIQKTLLKWLDRQTFLRAPAEANKGGQLKLKD